MNTLINKKSALWLYGRYRMALPICLALLLAIALFMQLHDQPLTTLDPSIWQVWAFALFSFISVLLLSLWLFAWGIAKLALPPMCTMVSQFKKLALWQQFVLYWASFALLLLGGLISLLAIF